MTDLLVPWKKTKQHVSGLAYNLFFLDESNLCTSEPIMNNVGSTQSPGMSTKKQRDEENDLICYLAPILTFWCCYQRYARGGNYGHHSASEQGVFINVWNEGEGEKRAADEEVEKGENNDFLGTCRSELSSCRLGVLLFRAGITLDSDGNYNC